jgi:predicted RecA/RadA family phage recombinase
MSTKVTLKIPASDSKPVKYTNAGSAIAARTLVLLTSGLVGFAQADIAASTAADPTGILHTAGVVEIAKNTHATTKAFSAGESVFWDTANNRVDKAGTADCIYIGTAYKNAGSTDTTMWIELNCKPAMNFVGLTVSSGQAAANSGDGEVDIVTGLAAAPTYLNVTVIDASSGVLNTGYVVDLATAGTIKIKGVSSGIQLDASDLVKVAWIA